MEMDLLPDDFSILTGGGAETSLKKQVASYPLPTPCTAPPLLTSPVVLQIQDDTGATLITIKEDGLLKIRGSRTAVKAAEAAVKKVKKEKEDDPLLPFLAYPEATDSPGMKKPGLSSSFSWP